MNSKSKDQHTQAPIYHEGKIVFAVDEKLQSLIQFFFDLDITTYNSCQDNVRGTCWIEYGLGDWIDLADIAFQSDSQELYRFIEENCEVILHSMDDGEPDENDEYWIEGENLIWSASVRFPNKLLPAFEKLVRATLAAKTPLK